MTINKDWFDFQEEICSYFNSIGAIAETNVTKQGVRTTHNIDVLIKTKFLGQDLLWIVEAEKWKSRVGKLQVLALKSIAEEIGADKAFIICENGFQSGAIEASQSTNIELLTFEELKKATKEQIQDEIIKSYETRLKLLQIRYYSHSKKIRKDYGLRGEIWEFPSNFSGFNLLLTAHYAIDRAREKEYPINLETYLIEKKGELIANNFQEVINWLNLILNFLDEKLIRAEIEMIKNGEHSPLLISLEESSFFEHAKFNPNLEE